MAGNRKERIRLTDAFCRAAKPPAATYRCSELRGFALRVTPAGHRAFVFCYSSPTRGERRMTIGEYGPWTLQAARKRVMELRQMVDRGIDPLAVKEGRRKEYNLGDLFEWLQQGALKKLAPSSQRDQAANWRRHILPLLGTNTKLSDISRGDVQGLVDKVSERSGSVTGNRVHSYLRRALNLAVAEGIIADNVALRAIQRNPEQPRMKYLSRDETSALHRAIDSYPIRRSALAIRLLMLTGARRAEVFGMRWAEVDFERGVWTKPPTRTKQRRIHRTPLSSGALKTLEELKHLSGESEFVFPGPGTSGHLVEIKRVWKALCKDAGIKECRVHDLRHTYASTLASEGHTLQTVGALLGHTQTQTTQRYAHLFDDVLRNATESISKQLF